MSLLDTPALTTALDAVNLMLSTIGEPAVTSLETPADEDVALAAQILGMTSRTLQAIGWDFNSETKYPINTDIDGYAYVTGIALKASAYDPSQDITVRGDRLYDKKNHTYVFTLPTVYVNIAWMLPFEELPQSMRDYVAIVAARAFQRRIQGDQLVERFTESEELAAKCACLDADMEGSHTNIFNEHGAYRVINRGFNY